VPAALDHLHAALARFWAAAACTRAVDPAARMAFETGLAEIAGNVVRHAYPAGAGDLEVRIRLHADRLEALLADHGEPFVEPAPGEAGDPFDLADHGRGLALARRVLDTVEYARSPAGVNAWRLVKRA
jgi:anti-sigma regulatory factor (Ser/Thr protein kinase)